MSTANLKLPARFFTFAGKLFTRKQSKSCENELSKESFYHHSSLQQEPSSGLKAPNLQFNSLTTPPAPASPEIADGQPANRKQRKPSHLRLNDDQSDNNKRRIEKPDFQSFKIRLTNALYFFWSSPRLRLGILFVLILAPASKFVYLLFPENGFGPYILQSEYLTIPNFLEPDGWYFYSVYYYLFSLSEFLTPILSTIGIFFLFPKNYYPSYITGIPLGYYLAMFINRTTAATNEDFHGSLPFTMVVVSILFAFLLMYLGDKILFTNNHRKRAIEARIIGLINMPGMSWKDKEELLKNEAKAAAKEDNELFVRVAN
jgi:hypothetical protein